MVVEKSPSHQLRRCTADCANIVVSEKSCLQQLSDRLRRRSVVCSHYFRNCPSSNRVANADRPCWEPSRMTASSQRFMLFKSWFTPALSEAAICGCVPSSPAYRSEPTGAGVLSLPVGYLGGPQPSRPVLEEQMFLQWNYGLPSNCAARRTRVFALSSPAEASAP